jgi:hypothetical protein
MEPLLSGPIAASSQVTEAPPKFVLYYDAVLAAIRVGSKKDSLGSTRVGRV